MPGNCLAASRAAGGTGQGLPSGAWAATGKRCGGGSDLASLGSRSVALPAGSRAIGCITAETHSGNEQAAHSPCVHALGLQHGSLAAAGCNQQCRSAARHGGMAARLTKGMSVPKCPL